MMMMMPIIHLSAKTIAAVGVDNERLENAL